jgi:hypothetical protein
VCSEHEAEFLTQNKRGKQIIYSKDAISVGELKNCNRNKTENHCLRQDKNITESLVY